MICEKCGYFNPKNETACQRCGASLDADKQNALAAVTPVRTPLPGLGWLPALGGLLLCLTLFIPGPNALLFHASTLARLADLSNPDALGGSGWFYLAAGIPALLIPLVTMLGFLIYLAPQRLSRFTARTALIGLIALALAMAAFIREMLTLDYFDPLFTTAFVLTAVGLILICLPACRYSQKEQRK